MYAKNQVREIVTVVLRAQSASPFPQAIIYMTKQTESAISNETGRQLTDQDKAERRLAEALYEGFKSKADAMVIGSIDEVGIDGEFNLLEIAVGALSRMSNRDG